MEIKLTKGQVAQVDDFNYEWLSQHKWQAQWCKNTQSYYAVRTESFYTSDGKYKRRTVLMHRQILGLKPGERDPITGKKITGDHEDHDTLNNQDYNLRIASDEEQQRNRRLRSDNTTGVKGVTKRPNGRYQAQISVNGEKKHLGTCDTPEEAHALWWQAAQELHGEFSCVA
jgi:hypothetical protein